LAAFRRPALLTFGQLSDRLGRRVVIAIGLVLAAWHLRNRGGTARQTTHTAARREGSLVRSGKGT
jgi:MFS family permease